MNQLSSKRRAAIVSCLVEGNSIRATCRMTGTDKGAVLKLLVDLGTACKAYQDETFHDLSCKRIQCDEIWSFCHAKEKNVPDQFKGEFGHGDVWTFTAVCADTKLVPCFRVGRRDAETASAFMSELASRLANRVQLTTDGAKMYLQAVEDAFGDDIDFAMLVKMYGEASEPEKRYSPAQCIGAKKERINGNPDKRLVSTSYVERQNLTIRMTNRRFTRLTNAFSKKVENLEHSLALQFMHYNFCRIHQTLRVTPAMQAGVTDHVWEISDIVDLLSK